ncbi:UNVERIFIED_CONTAM: putative nucleoredoxin 1-1 [Sesamum latifolium]|uniref:Nucleoredoxin 1-1 n=1 Tax=Sesamum latifolium TaxID=2727402 RepID=A0AAW2XCZ5_9LAMI
MTQRFIQQPCRIVASQLFNLCHGSLAQESHSHHFTHPAHPLTAFDSQQDYLCNGCKTPGNGKRYRCQRCDFDLHDYCGTCPRLLSSFMHKNHSLSLVTRKPQGARQVHRICDVCRDPVEGLFYRCKECEFDVHPLCTQLPEKLQHALHKTHPLVLQSSTVPGFCAVCRGSCSSWRYRCGLCSFDIHLECVLVPVVPCRQKGQGSKEREFPCMIKGFLSSPRHSLVDITVMGGVVALVTVIRLDQICISRIISTRIRRRTSR